MPDPEHRSLIKGAPTSSNTKDTHMKRLILSGLAVLGLIALAPNESKAVSVYIGPAYPYYNPYYTPNYYGYGYYYHHHWRHWHRWHHWRHWRPY
jgi:hypothetical protein